MKFLKIIVIGLMCLLAIDLISQETSISGDYKGSIPKVLKKLRNQHQLKFAYDYNALKDYKIDLNFDNQRIEEVLQEVLLGSGFSFRYIGETIVLFKDDVQQNYSITITGRVVDDESGEALPYTNIFLAQEGIGTNSNEDGDFIIKELQNPKDTVVVSFLGYETVIKPLSEFIPGSFNLIRLKSIQQFLPTIQITSERSLAIASGPALSEYNINPSRVADVPFVGAPDLFKSIQTLPGINSGNETSSELIVRGGRSDENLVLLDGFKLYNLDHFFGIFSTINPDIIKNVKVYKSGFDASYGGRVSSVIDLNGKEGNNNRASTSISMNTSNISGLVETPIFYKNLTFVAAIRRAHSDLYQNPLYEDLFGSAFDTSANSQNQGLTFENDEIPEFNFYDAYSKLSFRPNPDNKFSLTFYRGQDNFRIQNVTERTFNFTLEKDENNYIFDWGNVGLGGLWSKHWGENVFSKITLGKSSFNRNYYRLLRLIDEDLISEQITTIDYSNSERSTLEDLSLRAEIDIERRLGEKINLGFENSVVNIVGTNNRQDTLPSLTSNYDVDGYMTSVWLSFEKELKEISLQIGNRTTYYSETSASYWSPRFRIKKKLDEQFSIHLNAGKYYQFVRRTNRQNIFLNQPERWLLANNDSIPVLSSNHISGGIRYTSKEWNVDFEGYIKNTDGNILNRNDILLLDLQEQSNAIARGTSSIGGIEFFIHKLKGKHTGRASFSVSQALEFYGQEGNSINDGQAIFSPDNKTFDLNTTYQYNLTHWQFSTNFIWSSGTHYTPLLGVDTFVGPDGSRFTKAEYGEEFSITLRDYISVNLAINYKKRLNWTNLSAGLSINNILDRENVKSKNYIPTFEERGELAGVDENDIYLLGITPSLNIKLTF